MAGLDVALYSILSQDATTGPLVADSGSPATYRIFPVFAGENPTLPCLIYGTISAVREDELEGPMTWVRERIQIDCFADSYTDCKTLAEAVRKALNGYSGTVSGKEIFYASLDNQQDFYDDKAVFRRISLDFIITHKEEQ